MPVANNISSIRDLPKWEQDLLRSGMRSPRLRQVSSGTKIYRFADLSNTSIEAVKRADPEAGGWWFGQKAFNKIMADCVQHDTVQGGLGWSARRAMAVLYEWSDCDVLVEGYLKKSVRMFQGRGHKQRESCPIGTIVFEGWDDVDQWYIPSISQREQVDRKRTHTRLNSFGESVISVYRVCSVKSYQWYKKK